MRAQRLKATLAALARELPRTGRSLSSRSALARALCAERLVRRTRARPRPLASTLEVLAHYFVSKGAPRAPNGAAGSAGAAVGSVADAVGPVGAAAGSVGAGAPAMTPVEEPTVVGGGFRRRSAPRTPHSATATTGDLCFEDIEDVDLGAGRRRAPGKMQAVSSADHGCRAPAASRRGPPGTRISPRAVSVSLSGAVPPIDVHRAHLPPLLRTEPTEPVVWLHWRVL